MPAHLTRLTTVSRQPSLRDYDPDRHAVPLSFILHSHSQDEANIGSALSDQYLRGGENEINLEGSFRILLYDAPSAKVKELVFSAEQDFDSNVLTILESAKPPEQGTVSSLDTFNYDANAHESDPLLCETILRCIFAQGTSGFGIEERLKMTEKIKQAFLLADSSYQEVKSRAMEAVQYRRAEIQAQLEDLQQDNGWTLLPHHFESLNSYEEYKSEELKYLSNTRGLLQELPDFCVQIEINIESADMPSTVIAPCVKSRSCYRWADAPRVYCTVMVIPAGQHNDRNEESIPIYRTKEAGYVERAEWDEKSPWISVNSVHDQLCIKMWRRSTPAGPSKGSKELELGSFIRNLSHRRRRIASHGDQFLGQVLLPMSKIELQAAVSANICGKIPKKSYSLSNVHGGKTMIYLQLQFEFRCELLRKDPAPNEMWLKPPLKDLQTAYDALVQVAYGMHLEGEYQVEKSWQNILFCFESHYRLRRERCCLAVVKHMALLFEPQVDYLTALVEEWKPVCKAAKEGKLTQIELSLHAEIISMLIKPSIDAIEDFQSLFHLNQSKGALSRLIELLSLILCWDSDPREAIACFKRWVKVSCAQRFEKLLCENSKNGEITSKTFSTAISSLRQDFERLILRLQTELPREIDLFQICASEYYRLISQYITGIVGAVKITSQDFEDLTRELALFHKQLETGKVKMDFIDLHGLLRDHILDLIASIKPRMIDWIISSISDEKWEPISAQTEAYFSCSVVDLYFMINGVVENMTKRLSYFPFGKLYYLHVEESICAAVRTYLQITEKLCLQELPENFDEHHHRHFLSHLKSAPTAQATCITKTLCVKLNNLHAISQQQRSLEMALAKKWENFLHSSLDSSEANGVKDGRESQKVSTESAKCDDIVGEKFGKIHELVKQSISNVTGSIVESMQFHLTRRLQKVMETCSSSGQDMIHMDDLELLTTYLDDHLKVLNEWLDSELFRGLLVEIAGALVFCMEEFALNRDEDPNPMTARQRICLEQTLTLFYAYFYGDGIGISKPQMDNITARLRKILECSDLDTRDLLSLYWKAWEQFNADATSQKALSETDDGVQLHVLDYLLLLQQRDDDEARIIATNQKLLAKNKMMQFIFGLPKDEEMVAAYTCRDSKRQLGTLCITAKHVSFAATSIVVPDNRRLFILPFERIRQVNLVGFDSISIVPSNNHSERFGRFSDRDAVLQIIYAQVKNTGTVLERFMAPVFGHLVGESLKTEATSLKCYKCCRQGLISRHQGSLTVSAACLTFEPQRKNKKIYVDHGAVSRIHAARKGFRASGVVIELKSGHSIEFVDFDLSLPLKDIAQEIEKLVLGGLTRRD